MANDCATNEQRRNCILAVSFSFFVFLEQRQCLQSQLEMALKCSGFSCACAIDRTCRHAVFRFDEGYSGHDMRQVSLPSC